MKTSLVGLVALSALLVLPSASAKDFHPGDLRVCNTTRCIAIVNRAVLPQLGSFYYGGPSPAPPHPLSSCKVALTRPDPLRPYRSLLSKVIRAEISSRDIPERWPKRAVSPYESAWQMH